MAGQTQNLTTGNGVVHSAVYRMVNAQPVAACGIRLPRTSGGFFGTNEAVTCEKCGVEDLRVDEFASWDSPTTLRVSDEGDSVSLASRVNGMAIEVNVRIRPEELRILIAQLTAIADERGL